MTKIDKFFAEVSDSLFQAVGFNKFDENFVKQDGWYTKRTWTSDQQDNFKRCFIAKAKKDLKLNRKRAELEYQWFNLNYGWRVKDD